MPNEADLAMLAAFLLILGLPWLVYRRPARPVEPPSSESMAAAVRAGHPSAMRLLTMAERRVIAEDAADRLAAAGMACSRYRSRPVIHTSRNGVRYRLAVGAALVTVDYVPEHRPATRREFASAHEAVTSVAVASGSATAFTV